MGILKNRTRSTKSKTQAVVSTEPVVTPVENPEVTEPELKEEITPVENPSTENNNENPEVTPVEKPVKKVETLQDFLF